MTPVSTSFRIDEAKADWVERCLLKAGLTPSQDTIDKLARAIESDVDWFKKNSGATSFTSRRKRDAIRELFFLANDGLYDPTKRESAIKTLRAKIEDLPEPVMLEIDRIGFLIISRLFRPWPLISRGKSVRQQGPSHKAWDRQSWNNLGGFRAWARTAGDEELLRATQAMTSGGAVIVPGRSRGAGKQSRQRIEPYVMGVVRGAPGDKPKGGRPGQVVTFFFVCSLAESWERATGAFPKAGRSDHTGFGDLIHHVFGWLDHPASAENSLRYFWEAMKEKKASAKREPHRT
jgi:hypothetical protein